MVDNLEFMENIVYNGGDGSLPITLEITQNDMSIIPKDVANNTVPAYVTNLDYFTLSENGEELGTESYNTDGEIILNIAANTNRATILAQTPSTPFKFTEINVDYDEMPENMKTTKDVRYEIINIAAPTRNGEYNSVADNNGASLYANSTLTEFNNMSLTSNLVTENDEIMIIKVEPLTTVTNSNPNIHNLYVLDDVNSNSDIHLNAHVDVSITGNISLLRDNDDLRLLFYPKTLTQLNIAIAGDVSINPIELVNWLFK
jgi:hypothetical protein